MSRREFQLIEGKSRKFWSIELDGQAHTVQFGRIGTAGQTQRKEFPTTTGAKASYDNLIAEKLKKGYEETTSIAKPASGKLEPAAPGPARAKPVPKAETPAVAPPLSSLEPEAQAANALEPISTVRSIDLDPVDWLWATWRPRSPLPRPELKPFDLEDCLDRLSKVTRASHMGTWNWGKVAIAPMMTRAEAHFWMVAITEVIRRELQPAYFIQELRCMRNAFDGTITSDQVVRLMRPVALYLPPRTGILLANLFRPGDLISLSRKYQALPYHHALGLHESILDGFRKSILPYLSDAERRAMQHEVRATIGTPALPPDHYTAFPLESYLAAALGLHEEVGRVVRGIPDDYYHGEESDDIYQRPQRLIFGLGDPAAVVTEMHRLKLLLRRLDDIHGWIAHTEDASPDLVRDSVLKIANREECAALIKVLAVVKSPRTAGSMLELMLGSKAPGIARGWLDAQPGHAIPGLFALAAGQGKLADAALDYLRSQKRKGHEGYIRECLASAPPDIVEKVRREVFERLEEAVPILDDKTTPRLASYRLPRRQETQATQLGRGGRSASHLRRWPQAEYRAVEFRAGGPRQERVRCASAARFSPQDPCRSPIARRLRLVFIRAMAGRAGPFQGEVGHGCDRPFRFG
ncbi:MAG: WGR domain-containing protein [Isosphaeraceae bacterium]